MTKARDLANAGTALTTVSATELGYLDGVTSAVQTQMDAKLATSTAASTYLASATASSTYAPLTAPTLTAPVVISPEERMTVSATAATGTINFDADTQGVLYYTSNASADWTLNVRGSSGTTINSKLATGDSTTVAFLVTNGSTAYKHSALTIDGSAQTVKWSGGTAPSAGNASAIDAYSFTIIKTASATYTVLGAGPIKYA
jgi:hypothetical protein